MLRGDHGTKVGGFLDECGSSGRGDASVPTSRMEGWIPDLWVSSGRGDASVPTQLHTTPAPTRGIRWQGGLHFQKKE